MGVIYGGSNQDSAGGDRKREKHERSERDVELPGSRLAVGRFPQSRPCFFSSVLAGVGWISKQKRRRFKNTQRNHTSSDEIR